MLAHRSREQWKLAWERRNALIRVRKREVGAEGGIVSVGVAQVLDDWAIPFSSRSSGGDGELVLFVARRFIYARFAALLNTGITPVSS